MFHKKNLREKCKSLYETENINFLWIFIGGIIMATVLFPMIMSAIAIMNIIEIKDSHKR